MDDLISRAAAIEAMKRAAYWNDAERKITELHAVDAIPVEWLEKKLHEGYHRACTKAVLDMWYDEQEAR